MCFWIKIVTLLIIWLLLLYNNLVCSCPSILTSTCHLPADLHSRHSSCYLEFVVTNFFCDIEIWCWSTYSSELVTKLLVECFEPVRQFNNRFPLGIENYHPIIDIFHIG